MGISDARPAKIPILHEDNHLLVVVKPPMVPSQGDDSGDPDMLTLLKADLKRRHNKPGNVFLGLVHRLDRPVGGVMVFAKTSKAASRLADQLRRGAFRKTYLAVVDGRPRPCEQTLIHWLRKDARANTVSVHAREIDGAKRAELRFQSRGVVRVDGAERSLLAVELVTGRPHQIRAQLAHIGHPLLGDRKYAIDPAVTQASDGVALWSWRLEFQHPTRDETLEFRQHPPRTGPWSRFDIAP